MAIDQRAAADFDLPTGQYSRTSSVNIGSNTFTLHPYYAITVFPGKRFETSWRVHYLWNSTNTNPPLSTDARSTQAGQAIHFNATFAYKLWKGLWIGPNGYYLKQITDGKIDSVALRNSPEQVGAIGPGMVWNIGSWLFIQTCIRSSGREIAPPVINWCCESRRLSSSPTELRLADRSIFSTLPSRP
jgi:hypothetical protein